MSKVLYKSTRCPFCAGENTVSHTLLLYHCFYYPHDNVWFYVRCGSCGARGPLVKGRAWRAWVAINGRLNCEYSDGVPVL